MTKINTTALQQIQNISLEDFKTAYRDGNSVATAYYEELRLQGQNIGNQNIQNYASLAQTVTTNNGFRGEYANVFSREHLAERHITFEVGDDNWLTMQHALMQEDFRLRNDTDETATGELNWEQTNDIHDLAFQAIGADGRAYSPYTSLQIIGERGFQAGQDQFEDLISANSLYYDNVVFDAVQIWSNASLSGLYPEQGLLDAWGDQIQMQLWTRDIGNAGLALGGDYIDSTFQQTNQFLNGIGTNFNDFLSGTGIDDLFDYSREYTYTDYFGSSQNFNIFGNSDLSSSFTSLGFSSSQVNDFSANGWGAFGSSNAGFDDFAYDFGGRNYTIFGENDRLSLNLDPFDIDVGGFNTIGNYSIGTGLDEALNSWANGIMNRISPLTFDLDGDGIESNHIYSQNVFFDIDGDGYAEKVGWIDSDDGQLALDVNGDGIINDITELFGDDIMRAYDKLRLHDTNGNGMIDQGDDDYANFLVWRDFDQDGFSDAGELFALDHADIQIKEISLAETEVDEFQNENYFCTKSTFTRFDNTTGEMVDVHFLNDNVNTWFQGAQSEVFGSTYEVSPEALLMPLSRGYGSLASLHIAMTDNTDLRGVQTCH